MNAAADPAINRLLVTLLPISTQVVPLLFFRKSDPAVPESTIGVTIWNTRKDGLPRDDPRSPAGTRSESVLNTHLLAAFVFIVKFTAVSVPTSGATTLVEALIVPVTSSATVGAALPIPRRLVALSQKRLASWASVDPGPPKMTRPVTGAMPKLPNATALKAMAVVPGMMGLATV